MSSNDIFTGLQWNFLRIIIVLFYFRCSIISVRIFFFFKQLSYWGHYFQVPSAAGAPGWLAEDFLLRRLRALPSYGSR